MGEFGPLIAISLFLGGRDPGVATVVLLLFVAVVGAAIWWAFRVPQGALHRAVNISLHTSGQFAIRVVFFSLAVLVAVSMVLDLDMLLGAFAAGVVWKLIMRDAEEADREAVESKVEAVAFGFLVPVFFIYTGITFDLEALLADPDPAARASPAARSAAGHPRAPGDARRAARARAAGIASPSRSSARPRSRSSSR